MKHHIRHIVEIILFGCALGAFPPVHADGKALAVDELKAFTQGVDKMARLPGTSLSMVQAGRQRFLMSGNGRFVIVGGKLVDVWNNERISSFADLEDADRINLRRMRIRPADIGAHSFGSGAREAWMFFDPRCRDCFASVAPLLAIDAAYTTHLVLLPFKGKASQEIITSLHCARETDGIHDIIRRQAWESLPRVDLANCDPKPLQKALISAQLIGITDMPFLIAPDGRIHRGPLGDLNAFLNGPGGAK